MKPANHPSRGFGLRPQRNSVTAWIISIAIASGVLILGLYEGQLIGELPLLLLLGIIPGVSMWAVIATNLKPAHRKGDWQAQRCMEVPPPLDIHAVWPLDPTLREKGASFAEPCISSGGGRAINDGNRP